MRGTVICCDAGVISGALLYIEDDFDDVQRSSFLQVHAFLHY